MAGTFNSNFDAATPPPGTTLNGTSVIEPTGGVGGSGVLKLTKALNSQSGSFVIDDLDAGNPVYGFDLTAKVRLGGGTSSPADGFSINFDPTASSTTTTGEEGTSGGITVAFDIYDNGSETPPAPSIDLKVGGTLMATHKMTIPDFDTGAGYADLHVTVAADGATSLAWKGAVLFTNVYFAGYQALSGASFVFGARTGGANENQWIDDLSITTFTTANVGIVQQPLSGSYLLGQAPTLTVTANNADTATYQWFKNGSAVAGATQPTLTLPTLALSDSGAKYKVTVTGPNNAVTSQEATITVKDITLPASPTVSYNFDSGTAPANTTLIGTAAIGSGVLQITTDVGDQAGAFIVSDLAAGAPVYGLTAQFDVQVRSAATPADGFSFNFASDIPDDPTVTPPRGLEEGTGSGLTVVFDVYDNGGGEAPSIDIVYRNQTVASAKVPLSFITTGDQTAHVIIHLDTDGTMDVVYKGVIIHDNVPVPGFGSITGGRFAFAGRTGGSSADQWIDNLQITVDKTVGALRLTTAPTAQTVLLGKTATFSAVVNDPTGVTYQWYKNGTAIAGATASTYTTPATVTGDNAAAFKVIATKGAATAESTAVALTVLNLAAPATPQLSYDFNNGQLPADIQVFGGGTDSSGNTFMPFVDATGGVNNSGVLKLMIAENSLQGAALIGPVLSGAELSGINVSFDIRVGGGTAPPPADGFSFNFASDLPAGVSATAEDGLGSGLSIGFDIYNNGNETPPAPSIDVKYKGALVATTQMPFQDMETGDAYRTVLVRVTPDGKLDLAYGDRVLAAGLQLPNYTFTSNGKFGFYARTGGLNENEWIDNIKIEGTKSTAPLRITQDLADVVLLPGSSNVFTIALSDPAGATYQWFKNGTAIPGATTASYTTPAFTAADTGTKFYVQSTGPGGTIKSHEAIVTVVAPLTVSNPQVSFNFDDGQVPAGAEISGTAVIADGFLHLTDAVNSQGGTILIGDLNNGAPVSGFTATFKLLVGGGTTPPADGLSFVWVTDLPSGTIFGEDGSGTGLVISFDIYDNGNETPPAPSVDVRYNGQAVGTVRLTYQQMETGTEFADFGVRVEPDGTLDLQFKGTVLFNNLALPGFTPMTGAVFAIGARTGGLNDNQWIDNLQIATSTGSAAPQMSISRDATGKLTIQWAGGGVLQSTPSLSPATWTDVAGATSPYSVTSPTGSARFYRVRQ